MHIISQKRIKKSVEEYPNVADALLAWLKLMKNNNPANFSEMKRMVNSIDKVNNYHIFDIGGNKLRLIAVVDYKYRKLFIREILTHSEYEKRRFK
jgi:mRNA interferase HigB